MGDDVWYAPEVMAPLPMIADTFRCALEWTFGAETAVNVIHIRTDASGKTPSDVFTLIDAHVTTAMWDSAPNTSGIGQVTITKLDGASVTATFSTAFASKWLGNQAGTGVPALAVLMKESTAFRGRSFRGRIFIPFTADAVNSNGFLAGGVQTAMTNAWVAFQAALGADGTTPATLVVASYKLAQASNVTVIAAERALATQRRRQQRLRV